MLNEMDAESDDSFNIGSDEEEKQDPADLLFGFGDN